MKSCFHCGQQYREVWTGGKIQPLNVADDRPHWQTCSAKGKNRLRTRVARKYRQQNTKHQSAPPIEGKEYRPACADCPSLPWEPCRCFWSATT